MGGFVVAVQIIVDVTFRTEKTIQKRLIGVTVSVFVRIEEPTLGEFFIDLFIAVVVDPVADLYRARIDIGRAVVAVIPYAYIPGLRLTRREGLRVVAKPIAVFIDVK